ncbi:Leucyl aminopeptidase [Beutenbergia cavernae DSM 12333]|uniref:Probable cytosol aminopeptidase n=1 Tax=Beutenbergia cavernae (strain ATCC BAA-8 / DSM 12333 / CCUG 43141 / JCM 11478 / NBRC 16432 / NCIMB 13614 / HKI 0122) TaxID=471853 RepID=C5C502_BEUC1|nr:leucyl aminopeptidase [Beutenbergia cavernae]ACQ80130.1 Leucyl aminopeptidase [Beutenbergia cavernae DSM 12333]
MPTPTKPSDVTLSQRTAAEAQADVLVVPLATGDGPGGATPAVAGLDDVVERAVIAAIRTLRLAGTADEVTKVPAPDGIGAQLLVLTGTGAVPGAATEEALRRAAGAALRALTGHPSAALAFPDDSPDQVGAAAEGALLGAYGYRRYRAGAAAPSDVTILTSHTRAKAYRRAVEDAAVVARAVSGTRDLVNAAPADLYPASFADAAKAAAKGTKVKVSVLDDADLVAGGYGGLVGVGQGSARPPRLVKVVYSPARARTHVALVGKGITFDSGGLSIKPAKGMETMKSDMAGAAAVLHTVLAAAALELPVRVTGWLALAENMPSGTAQRPSDVITIRGGTTVEVLNTDAEGRLVLADALVAACEESPDAVIDIATLTGAQVVALGTRVSAVMGTDDVRDAVVSAADDAGEQFWPMPLPSELRASLDSPVADLANIGDRFGGMLVAGIFLSEFVGDVPWGHLDVAGPAFNEGSPHGYTPKGGTGVGVRTLLSYLERVSAR